MMMELMMEYPWLLPAIMMVVGACLLFIMSRSKKDKTTTKSEEAPKEIELTERFFMSKYLGGFSNSAEPASFGYCAVTEDSFIFVRGTRGAEIGRIPRDAINNVVVGEKHQIAEQLSSQEKLCLGKISTSKKDNGPCLVINWKNSDSTNHNSIFKFTEQSAANSSATILKKWIKQQQTPD